MGPQGGTPCCGAEGTAQSRGRPPGGDPAAPQQPPPPQAASRGRCARASPHRPLIGQHPPDGQLVPPSYWLTARRGPAPSAARGGRLPLLSPPRRAVGAGFRPRRRSPLVSGPRWPRPQGVIGRGGAEAAAEAAAAAGDGPVRGPARARRGRGG